MEVCVGDDRWPPPGVLRCSGHRGQSRTSDLNPPHSRTPWIWFGVPIWLAAFVSPTALVFLLGILNQMQVPAPPDGVVAALFCLTPFAALLACCAVVWRSGMSRGWRIAGLVLTLLAMSIQCGVWFLIIVSVIAVAISPV